MSDNAVGGNQEARLHDAALEGERDSLRKRVAEFEQSERETDALIEGLQDAEGELREQISELIVQRNNAEAAWRQSSERRAELRDRVEHLEAVVADRENTIIGRDKEIAVLVAEALREAGQ